MSMVMTSNKRRRGLSAALNCPVNKSLPPEIERPTKFFWEGQATAFSLKERRFAIAVFFGRRF